MAINIRWEWKTTKKSRNEEIKRDNQNRRQGIVIANDKRRKSSFILVFSRRSGIRELLLLLFMSPLNFTHPF